MPQQTNRRQFMQTTAATGIGFWVAGGVQAQESKSPNERIAFASVGIGGKGSSDSNDAGRRKEDERVVSLAPGAPWCNTTFGNCPRRCSPKPIPARVVWPSAVIASSVSPRSATTSATGACHFRCPSAFALLSRRSAKRVRSLGHQST